MSGLRLAISRKKFECDLDALVNFDQKAQRIRYPQLNGRGQGRRQPTAKMSQLPKGSPEFLAKVAEMKELATKVKDLEAIAKEADDKFKEAFMTVPNIPHESTPDGKGEEDNQSVSTWGNVEGKLSPMQSRIMIFLGLIK